MRLETRLDSAVFQLTPTRTRCDLLIITNGKTEKIASGLVNPFLSHLKTAQDQIARGGYSIKLEPDPSTDTAWFTKSTVERFVRFVSTPEVLERVNTIESEILQIDEAISIQGNDNIGLSTVEELHQVKSSGSIEGNKTALDADAEKAIILYKPGSHPNNPESNGSKMPEENSKVQLIKVLESRKKVLQKEQAMAFARAEAAGFDMENMATLISFAESFGASRLMDACRRYMQLWKGKHETGQWIEVEAAEALYYRSEFSPLNTSGVILSGDAMKQKEFVEAWPVSGGDMGLETNGYTTSQDNDRDRKLSSEPQVPRGPPEYHHEQFQHPAFPPWPMLPQTGPRMFQPYSMQAMPYYQNYPVNGQFFHPPPPPMEDPRFNTPQRKGKKKHSMNSRDATSTSNDSDQSTSESEEEPSKGHRSHRKAGRSGKKKGVVVIRNLNYIAGKRHETPGSGSESTPDSDVEGRKDPFSDSGERKLKSSKSSKRKDNNAKSSDISNVHGKDEDVYLQDADTGNWQAFQSFLLRAEEKMTSAVNGSIFAGEKEPPVKKGQGKGGHDPILLPEGDSSLYREGSIMEYDAISGKGTRNKQVISTDELLLSREGIDQQDDRTVTQIKEIEGRIGVYRNATSDDFIINGWEKQMGSKVSSDPLVDCEYEHGENSEKSSSYNVTDESFMVPFRSGSQDLIGTDRRLTIGMDSELPSVPHKNEDSLKKSMARVSYEPDDLTLNLERVRETESVGYDPAIDYDIEVPFVVKQETKEDDGILLSTNEGLMRTGKGKKQNSPQGGLEKKRKDIATSRTASLRSTPLTEAQKRAEKLRNYKADLQKLKKEHEEEEMRRLEALKIERQKRIAARSGSNAIHSPATPQQIKPRLPAKVSHTAYKSSKFTDLEPESKSPLQKLPRNSGFAGSSGYDKVTKPTRSSDLISSSSSLPELKKESVKQELGSVSERIRRLSEPRGSIVRSVPAKSVSTNQVMKKPLPEEPQSKKISAIIHLDRTKSETLPELKIKSCGTPPEAIQNKPVTKQQKKGGSRTSLISETRHAEMSAEKNQSLSYSDENPVIEKTVVMLENEVVSATRVQTSDGKIGSVGRSHWDMNREREADTGYAAIRAPPSPNFSVEIENPTEGNHDGHLNSYEIVNVVSKDGSEFLNPMITGKHYGAPFARASSLEDPATSNFQNAEASPVPITERAMPVGIRNTEIHVHDVSGLSEGDQMNETAGKPRMKESKGLRKLWKFGRKSHGSGSGDGNLDSDGSVADDQVVATSSNDISTLKNLISQDETHTGGARTKVSRPFSILSQFRVKNNEKKVEA